MKKSEKDLLTPYIGLPVNEFSEKMTALCIQEYNTPDTFFDISKKAFILNQKNYSDAEQNKAIMGIFRDCYRAYNSEERHKLGDRFIDFTHDLDLNENVSYHVYEAFFLLIRKRPEGEDFLIKALHEDKFMDSINKDFVEEYSSYDNDIYRSVFVKRIEEIADCLYDSTYLYIAQTMTDRYTMYDYVIQTLIRREKTDVIVAFVSNTNFLCSKNCLNDIISYAKEKEENRLLLAAYHLFLMKSSITFKDFYSYYSMLSEEEIYEDQYFIERTVKNNHFDRAYQILIGDEMDVTALRGLSLDEFALLSTIIKERYPNKYQKYIRQAIEKKTEKYESDYSDLFRCLNAYKEDLHELLSCSGIKEASKNSDSARSQYLSILKENNLMDMAGIMLYKE